MKLTEEQLERAVAQLYANGYSVPKKEFQLALEAAQAPSLDPRPMVQRNDGLTDWRHSLMPGCDSLKGCHFEPRPEYSQKREDYA